ncbi:hypothetical protein DIS24_g2447 [Lasiodiplodia hormozganensis]|uniref:Ubiquitin 3 binding protein But2 C-terminal domain-containing protein n=1 Tax=Lasiodiplodia hormozganensis TaxID=869390 RepID=A0AA40D5V1_9PEZI|nr:hypothetical protein DIS24_g2447 [Lasiodiplodia hormozganensis]
MHFTTLTTAILSGAAFAAALPTSDAPTGTLERRACTTQYPTHLFQIMQDDPTHNTGDHGYVYTSQGDGKTSQWVTELQFAGIPAGAYGCSVEFFFQAGYGYGGPNSQPGVTTTGGTPENPTRLEFFSTDRDISLADTWNNHPGKVSSVGTQIVSAAPDHDTKLTVVTGACKETLNYLIEVQGDKAGSVGFFQNPPNGLRLTYNC